METSNLWGGLLPLWIIGAPWLLALVELARTPKTRVHDESSVHTPTSPTSPTATPYARPV